MVLIVLTVQNLILGSGRGIKKAPKTGISARGKNWVKTGIN